jgi:hypothetical protein
MKLSDQLKNAIKDDPRSVEEIANTSLVSKGNLYRFLKGVRGIGLATAESLLDTLGLEVVLRRKKGTNRKGENTNGRST